MHTAGTGGRALHCCSCRYVPGAQSKIKNFADKAKAYVNNVSELEMKVLEATNHEPWGPHGSAMAGWYNRQYCWPLTCLLAGVCARVPFLFIVLMLHACCNTA
eukprot:GHRQ01038806.1.p2 GENE.GHRQ01038806.1~~GHRQ01038806.1.p2  ORF type:complete len:103 (+),score=21.95 GHRQ01038806.1:432-740(+)